VIARFSPQQKLDMLRSIIWSKQTWLDQFSSGRTKRGDHEIDQKRQEVAVLRDIEQDIVRIAEGRASP